MLDLVEIVSGVYIVANSDFGGLGKTGLITTIIISIIIITAVAWLFHGTKKRD